MRATILFLFLFVLSACQAYVKKIQQPNIPDLTIELSKYQVIPLQDFPLNGLQVLYGNPEMEGAHFVIRIHIDNGIPVKSDLAKYFSFRIGDIVRSEFGFGTVRLGQCHPLNNLTQYLIKTKSGKRFGPPLIC